ncbi:natterin-3-like [Toxotes jaculatrix]|uniref:natterin-3-like n=1 Tax=Toxotes jaculatrix TaxID=941984 RepID=UPI001B3A97E6|nr:natterin-3-like [Toxotes jaculatrix]
MMKLSVLLLLVLPALSSASPLDTGDNAEQRNVSLMNSDPKDKPELRSVQTDLPLLSVAKLRQKRQIPSSPFVSGDGSDLQWVTWNNSLPKYAVSIFNGYADRIDYVCKYRCEAGFYTPSKGPYCHYPNKNKEYDGSPFEILVNRDNFEILEWKEDSYGSVPQNSVRTCSGENIFIGKNKYGLGKVSPQDKAFYLPWEGYEYWYHYYQVLTINKDIISQQIYDVQYNVNESKLFYYPPEVLRQSAISNYECRPVLKIDSLSKTYQVEQSWDVAVSIGAGVKTSITASLPLIVSVGIEFSTEVTLQFSWGNTVAEATTDTVTVELTAPPNHLCVVKTVQYKYKVDIPFTARLSRTYGNGEIHTMSISGTYDCVQVGEVRAVVDRCETLNNSTPCT